MVSNHRYQYQKMRNFWVHLLIEVTTLPDIAHLRKRLRKSFEYEFLSGNSYGFLKVYKLATIKIGLLS